MTAPASPAPRKLTALHYRHLAAGAQMVDDGGWQRPDRYRSVAEEVAAARERVALADISPVGKLDLKGAPERIAECGMRSAASGDQAPSSAGQVTAGELPGDGSSTSVRCCQLTPDHLLLLVAPAQLAAARAALSRLAPAGASAGPGDARRAPGVYVTDVTSALAGLAVIGPRSRDALRKLTSLDVDALPDSRCAETGLAGVHALLLRADRAGILAYELYVTRDVAEFVWDALMDAGGEYGVSPLGISAYRDLSTTRNGTADGHR